ncbi:hypothetical protein Q5Y75_27530 [Ruegeria sp. 2205SS24-7]|uniref:hypothetical protein n=1 Tax=Ruegeria discodermiae TaxID=3064389 RepID=UPI0027425BFE|nr:hypothetical protein [Ruegeria sp. 2205SS24-7]MDP5220942.1 hypothetical protein [Ruegeria sp. 2205SS24-7]
MQFLKRTAWSLRLLFSDRARKGSSIKKENQSQLSRTVKHMASVKAAWDKAPEGHKKATAFKQYRAAEKVHKAENDEEAHFELKQAGRALM